MNEQGQPSVLLGLKPIAERQIGAALFGSERQVGVVASAVEAGELCALAERRSADAVLVSPTLSGLGVAQCTRLRARGLRLLGLALDDRDAAALEALGVDVVLRPPLTPADLAGACTDPADTGSERTDSRPLAAAGEPVMSPSPSRRRAGSVFAVVSAERSPGASECAYSSAALMDRRWPTLLVDCDLHRAGLALRLGADPQQGSLLGLVRASADRDDDSLAGLLERWSVTGDGWPPLLLAPPDLDTHIDELSRPGATRSALEAAACVYPLVIADVGGLLATPGEVPKVARCHREALLTADTVLLVSGAREDQLQAGRVQLARLLDELEIKRARIRVCVSGMSGPGAASRAEAEAILGDELAALHLSVDGWLPYDRRALARSRRTGMPFALAHSRGPYARALRQLLDVLFIPGRPVTRERQHRLRIATPTRRERARRPPTTQTEPERNEPSKVDGEVPLPWRN